MSLRSGICGRIEALQSTPLPALSKAICARHISYQRAILDLSLGVLAAGFLLLLLGQFRLTTPALDLLLYRCSDRRVRPYY